MKERMIKCPRCHRSQPESLGACDFCTEAAQERAEELAKEYWEGEQDTDDCKEEEND